MIGGTADHLHLFHRLSRTSEPAAVVKEVKRGSSIWLKTKTTDLQSFAWQSGYGIFSIGVSEIESVGKYIANQEGHHRAFSFQDELRRLLIDHGVTFDERYMWD